MKSPSFVSLLKFYINSAFFYLFSFIFLLSSLDWSIFNCWDFVLDHRSHWIRVEVQVAGSLFFLMDNFTILNWNSWLRVFSSNSNNRWISFNCGSIHWDFGVILLFFSFSFLSCSFLGTSLIISSFLGIGLLFNLLTNLFANFCFFLS